MADKVDIEELRSKLKDNQVIFADEYCVDTIGKRAYMVAHPGASEKTAEANSTRMKKIPRVRAYIDARLAELAEKSEISAVRILKEERCLAYSDFSELFDDEGLCDIPPKQLPESIRRAVAGVEVTERRLYEFSDGERIEIGVKRKYKYKLWDKGRALERLEKHLGMFQGGDGNLDASLEKLGDRLASAIERSAKRREE